MLRVETTITSRTAAKNGEVLLSEPPGKQFAEFVSDKGPTGPKLTSLHPKAGQAGVGKLQHAS
jgi:hypothetical protein